MTAGCIILGAGPARAATTPRRPKLRHSFIEREQSAILPTHLDPLQASTGARGYPPPVNTPPATTSRAKPTAPGLRRLLTWALEHELLIVVVLSSLVVIMGVIPRWTQLGAQSLWTDEQFTYRETTGTYENLTQLGQTEVHTPFFATLLWLWHQVTGGGPVRIRAFSALVCTLAILAVPALLRRSRIPARTQWILMAIMSTSTLGFLYSQEARSYGLLWALSIALTTAHLNLDLRQERAQARTRRNTLVIDSSLAMWATIAIIISATHLFGLILAGCSIVLLIARRRVRLPTGIILLVVAAVPEAAWMIRGLFTPDFAAGAGWSSSPRSGDIMTVIQNIFGWGTPSMAAGGFYFASATGLIAMIATLALASHWRLDETSSHPHSPVTINVEESAAKSMAMLALLVLATTFCFSQFVPIWTLRNLIIIDPSVRFSVALIIIAASRRPGRRFLLIITLIAISLASIISVESTNSQPWKTDFRTAARLIVDTRLKHPGVKIGGNPSVDWTIGTSIDPTSKTTVDQFTPDYYARRWRFPEGVRATPHDTLWIMYVGVSKSNESLSQTMVNSAGASHCTPIHIQGLGAMYCTAVRRR